MIENLEIARIRRDGGTQPRAALDEATITEYAEAVQAGAEFPPVDVFNDGERLWLADGFHRVVAHERAGKHFVLATIHQGDRRAAVLYSTGVNAEHGLRRTNADKRRAVEVLLRDLEWGKWNDNEIARQCKVSHTFVGEMRKAILHPLQDSPERTVTRAGTTYTMNTANIGSEKSEQSPLPAIEAAIRSWLTFFYHSDHAGMRTFLKVTLSGNEYGTANLDRLSASRQMPRPHRRTDLVTACEHILAELDSPEPQPATVVYTQQPPVPAAPETPAEKEEEAIEEPEPTPDLSEIVTEWLFQMVDENELPDDKDARRLTLKGILTARNNGYAAHWRSLSRFAKWPAGTADADKLTAVKTALEAMTGQPALPPEPSERRTASWADVPAAPAAPAAPTYKYPGDIKSPGYKPAPIVAPIAVHQAAESSLARRILPKLHGLLDDLISYAARNEEPDPYLAAMIEEQQIIIDIVEA